MAFYDVGPGDLKELWDSYLSDPVSVRVQTISSDKKPQIS